eukprot:5909728-Ditylum_brightwellii.AAC.1
MEQREQNIFTTMWRRAMQLMLHTLFVVACLASTEPKHSTHATIEIIPGNTGTCCTDESVIEYDATNSDVLPTFALVPKLLPNPFFDI